MTCKNFFIFLLIIISLLTIVSKQWLIGLFLIGIINTYNNLIKHN